MIKYLFIVINSLAVFLYSLFSGDNGINVSGTIPSTLKAGQEAPIEIKITKGSMSGFAKFQMELPEGLAVKETENKGANYTYSNGIAKWVWASLPPEAEIVIKIKLISSEEASGLKTITAKFSFVENNAKQVVEMTPAEMMITPSENAPAIATASVPATSETPSQTISQTPVTTPETPVVPAATESMAATPVPAEEPVKVETPMAVVTPETVTTEAPVTIQSSTSTETQAASETPVVTESPVTVVTPPVTETPAAVPAETKEVPDNSPVAANTQPQHSQNNSNAEPPGNISVARTVVKNDDNNYTIKLNIKKGSTKGFARYSDDLPEGVTVKALQTEGSSFSVGDGKLKFVWVNVPAKEELELEYQVTGSALSKLVLNGEYSYLEDNQSKKYKLPAESVSLSGTAMANIKAENNTIESNSNPDPVMQGTLARKEGNVNYQVQIGAFTNSKVDANTLKKLFHVSEAISSEMQGGYSKFMVGSHNEYKCARDHRESVKTNNGVKSAFVVAYNGSKRITVQEALMISNQKWFK